MDRNGINGLNGRSSSHRYGEILVGQEISRSLNRSTLAYPTQADTDGAYDTLNQIGDQYQVSPKTIEAARKQASD